MKTVTLTFSDAVFTRVVKALSNFFGYTLTIDDGLGVQIPNPVTRKDYLMTALKKWILDISRDSEVNDTLKTVIDTKNIEIEAARQSAQNTAAEIDVTITNG